MDVWHPRAVRVEPAHQHGGTYDDSYPWRQVGHTTEGGPNYYPTAESYYGNPYWPTATIARLGGVAHICQHFPINRSSYALVNASGGVETNRAKVVQFEIGWWTARIADLPADLKACVKDWVIWVAQQTGAPLTQFTSDRRMTAAEWRAFTGICGHRNVTENSHHDWPGLLDLAAPPAPTPENDMIDITCEPSWAAPKGTSYPGTPGDRGFFRLLSGDDTAPYEGVVIAYPGVPLMGGLPGPTFRYGDVFGVPALFIQGLNAKPIGITERTNGDVVVHAADGGTFRVAKKP